MRILFISQFFPPEIEPSAAKVYDVSTRLVQRGHRVTVVTGFPNYPTGVIPPEYRGRILQEENVKGVRVLRTFLIPSPNQGFRRRVVNEMSFMCSATLRSLFLEGYDVVVVSSPPLQIGLAGYAVSRLRRIPFVFEVRDAWPEAAIVLGVLRNPTIIETARRVERFIYRKAHHLVAVTQGVRQHLLDSGVEASRVTLLTNGVDTDLFRPVAYTNGLRERLNLANKFLCIYAGTHGLQASLSSVLEAAALLKSEPDIAFLLVGDGAEKRRLRQIGQERSLSNVVFLDPQPRSLLPQFLSMADAGIVHTRADAFFQGYLPVKMFEYMACGCPVVLANNGEARALIEKAQAGVWAEPENPSSIAEAILKLRGDAALRGRLSARGREYVVKHYSRDALTEEFEKLLTAVVGTK